MKRASAPERARREWSRRIEAEYRSAAITQHLTLWLIQIGASPDLIHDGLRIVRDELAHADLSHRAFVGGGGSGGPALRRDTLELGRTSQPLEHDVARVCVDVFCLGETVAVRLFKELRERCHVPVARRALDRILRDEVRHRDFGWELFAWLLESPSGDAIRKLVVGELPGYFARIRGLYAPAVEERAPPTSEEMSWGLMPLARYAAQLEKTYERDYVPRFAKLGIDARAAWGIATYGVATPRNHTL